MKENKLKKDIDNTDINKRLLKTFGFEENEEIDINDFLQFAKCFGIDKKTYLTLKSLKDKAEVSWEDISKLKYEDIDFQHHTINFPVKIKVKEGR